MKNPYGTERFLCQTALSKEGEKMAKTLSFIMLGVGLILLLGGVLWFVKVQGQIADFQSTLGQIGRLLSPQLRSQYQMLLGKRMAAAVLSIMGFIFMFLGVVNLSKK
jgi:hypothetical protein